MSEDSVSKLIIKLIVAFVVIFVMVIATGYFTFSRLNDAGDKFENVVTKTTPALLSLGQIKENTYFLLLEVNEYVLNPSDEHAAEFRKAKENLHRALDAYEQAEMGEETEILTIRQKMTGLISFGESIIDMTNSRISQKVLIENTDRLDELAEEFIGILDEELFRDTIDMISSQKAVVRVVRDTLNKSIGLALVTLLVIIVAGSFISLPLSRTLRKNKDNNKSNQEPSPSR